jgi:hypothetical protein
MPPQFISNEVLIEEFNIEGLVANSMLFLGESKKLLEFVGPVLMY